MSRQGTWIGWQHRVERLGGATLGMVGNAVAFLRFLFELGACLLRRQGLRRPAVRHVLIRQLYFTGVQGLPWVLLLALGAGVLAVYVIVTFAGGLGQRQLIGTLLHALLLQELAPLMVSLLLLARSGVAVAAEIAAMHLRREPLLLASLGIDRCEYLDLPRLLAFFLSGLILTVVFAGSAIWVGGLVVASSGELSLVRFFAHVQAGASLGGIVLAITKGAVYPMLCCAMVLFQAHQVNGSPNQVPVRVTRGVLGALVLLVLCDAAVGAVVRSW